MNEKKQMARRYDREFKENAVALVQSGRTISGVARDLGVTTWSLARWVQLQAGGGPRDPATRAAEWAEAGVRRRLRQENDHLRQQRDILKKALGILSAEVPAHATRW